VIERVSYLFESSLGFCVFSRLSHGPLRVNLPPFEMSRDTKVRQNRIVDDNVLGFDVLPLVFSFSQGRRPLVTDSPRKKVDVLDADIPPTTHLKISIPAFFFSFIIFVYNPIHRFSEVAQQWIDNAD
jgi:hypothetical protein